MQSLFLLRNVICVILLKIHVEAQEMFAMLVDRHRATIRVWNTQDLERGDITITLCRKKLQRGYL